MKKQDKAIKELMKAFHSVTNATIISVEPYRNGWQIFWKEGKRYGVTILPFK